MEVNLAWMVIGERGFRFMQIMLFIGGLSGEIEFGFNPSGEPLLEILQHLLCSVIEICRFRFRFTQTIVMC